MPYILVNSKEKKVNIEVPEVMWNYKLGLNVFEGVDEQNATWVEQHELQRVKVPGLRRDNDLVDGSFAGYLDANGQPVVGYFVFEWGGNAATKNCYFGQFKS